MAKSKIFVGVSGWTYEGWRGNFYPKGTKIKDELSVASQKISSIEVNGTFYSLQKPKSFESWYEQTPKDFAFSLKGGQFITHVKQLKDIDDALANFFASGVLCLKEKLRVILWQFAPFTILKDERFEEFFKKVPKSTQEAVKLARKHTAKVAGRTWMDTKEDLPILHAFEFRHESFLEPAFLDKMREHNVGWVMAHAGKKGAPFAEEVTADFSYLRLHGEGKEFEKGYSPKKLADWESKIKKLSKLKQGVYVYFDNAAKVTAPKNALSMIKKLSA